MTPPHTPRTRTGQGLWWLTPILAFVVLSALKLTFIASKAVGFTSEDEWHYLTNAGSLAEGVLYARAHFPPMNPIALIPATFAAEPYPVGVALMALYSSAIVFPIWLLAREFVGVRHASVVTLLSCLMPYHYVVPRTLMSENTYYAPLLFTFYLLVTERWKRPLLRDALTGVLVGVLILTRYLSLAFAPAFLIAWLLRERAETGSWIPRGRAWLRAALAIGMLAAVLSPWVLGQMSQGASFGQTLGAEVGFKVIDPVQLVPRRLAAYAGLYAGSFLLWVAPLAGLLGLAVADGWRDRWHSAFSRFTLTALLAAGGLWVIVTRHSWRAQYNWPEPLRIMNRYCVYMVALGLIVGYCAAVLHRRRESGSPLAPALLVIVLPAAALAVSWWLVLGSGFLPALTETAPDRVAGDTYHLYLLGGWFWVLIALALGVTAWLARRRPRLLPAAAATLMAAFWLIGMPTYISRISVTPAFQVQAQTLGPVLAEADPGSQTATLTVTPAAIAASGLSERAFVRGLWINMRYFSGKAVATGPTTKWPEPHANMTLYLESEPGAPDRPAFDVNGTGYSYEIMPRSP